MNKDLIAALNAFPSISKDKSNPHFKSKYATLDAINAVIKPILAKHKLAFMQDIWTAGDGIAIKTKLIHESGESIESSVVIFPCAQKTVQGFGSTITYARRYQLSAFLGITSDDDDDDGNAAAPAKSSKNDFDL
jgi:hypothetical protein